MQGVVVVTYISIYNHNSCGGHLLLRREIILRIVIFDIFAKKKAILKLFLARFIADVNHFVIYRSVLKSL